MWGAALLLLGGALVGLDGALGGAAGEDDSPYNDYYDRDPALNYEEEEEGDFYAIYDETDTIATLLTDPVTVAVSRKRRYEEPANAIEPQRMQYIQGKGNIIIIIRLVIVSLLGKFKVFIAN
ncbi:hypothetical protein B5X24_HaOG209016 [Helicoverpa armigera]|uniref:Uncharacterized protein n=1 Tax=Helicoverpa armigera TaxID=29058 RepID=A0A2W1BEV0_HELAM|nr:hypothetical protein B5X24_HaOG209016 [Helicoverpa armigera]